MGVPFLGVRRDNVVRLTGSARRLTRQFATLRQVPTTVIDAGLAGALGVAITIAISVSPEPGARRGPAAYLLGWTIAALLLARRRWPLAVLLASAAILQVYYQLDYPGIYPAVPLSVALATAWAAGHRLWSLLVVGLFVAAGVGGRLPGLGARPAGPPGPWRCHAGRRPVRGRAAARGGGAHPPRPAARRGALRAAA